MTIVLEVVLLSLIACTSDCVYQQDGYCALVRAGSTGAPCDRDPCINFVPRRSTASQHGRERFPNISDTNQL